MTLHSQFNLATHSFEDKGNFTGYGIKIVCIFYFHATDAKHVIRWISNENPA